MDDKQLATLETAAKNATPGPWEESPNPYFVHDGHFTLAEIMSANAENDAAYIAAANPAVVLELIADLRQARKERDWLAQQLSGACIWRRAEECPISCGVDDHCPRNSGKCRCLDAEKEDWLECAQEATCQKN